MVSHLVSKPGRNPLPRLEVSVHWVLTRLAIHLLSTLPLQVGEAFPRILLSANLQTLKTTSWLLKKRTKVDDEVDHSKRLTLKVTRGSSTGQCPFKMPALGFHVLWVDLLAPSAKTDHGADYGTQVPPHFGASHIWSHTQCESQTTIGAKGA